MLQIKPDAPTQALLQFVEYAPQAVAIFDTEMRYIAANGNWIAGYGLGDRDILGKGHYEIFPEIGEEWREIHRLCLAGKAQHRDRDPFPRADGRTDYITWDVRPWYDNDGSVGGLVMYTSVDTEQVETERQLKAAELENTTIVNTIPDLMFIFDENGVYLDAKESPQLLAPREELIGKKITDVIPGAIGEGYLHRFKKVLETGAESTFEYELEVPVGKLSYEARVIKLDEGRVLLLIRDVTTQKRLVENAERLYELERNLVNVRTDDDLMGVLSDEKVRGSATGVSLFYLESDDNGKPHTLVATKHFSMSGINIKADRYPIDQHPFTALWIGSADKVRIVSNLAEDERVDENTRGVLEQYGVGAIVIVPMNQLGRWIGVVSFTWREPQQFDEQQLTFFRSLPALLTPIADNLRLIKELEVTVNELKAANRIASENSRLKSEFLATMSHEMRTPMNAIEGFTSIMLSNMGGATYNDATRIYIEKVNSNSKRLLALINDFLDLSRIESGRLELANMPIVPSQLAARWQSDFSVLAENKGLVFTADVSDNVPEQLYGDEESISKIVINLVGNAIKFTEKGHVKLEVDYQDDSLVVSVADSGIGIPAHAREYIFDEFRQVDQSSKRRYGGTGLGLTIVQRLARAMGGQVTLQSEINEGTTFTVTLPLSTEQKAETV